MDVLTGRKIHHRVSSPARRPSHLFDFFFDRRSHSRIADVGIYLHEEIAADDHWLALRVIDIRGNDRASARNFIAHELGRDESRDARAEAHPGMLMTQAIGPATLSCRNRSIIVTT